VIKIWHLLFSVSLISLALHSEAGAATAAVSIQGISKIQNNEIADLTATEQISSVESVLAGQLRGLVYDQNDHAAQVILNQGEIGAAGAQDTVITKLTTLMTDELTTLTTFQTYGISQFYEQQENLEELLAALQGEENALANAMDRAPWTAGDKAQILADLAAMEKTEGAIVTVLQTMSATVNSAGLPLSIAASFNSQVNAWNQIINFTTEDLTSVTAFKP
jgi:hypothetical protein